MTLKNRHSLLRPPIPARLRRYFRNFLLLLVLPVISPDTNYMVRFLSGKFQPNEQRGFVLIPAHVAFKKEYLDKRALRAFLRMRSSAGRAGINLYILSGFRSFQDQKRIWEAKLKRLKRYPPKERVLEILKYSAMPGTSRHHWGSDIDIVYSKRKPSLTNRSFEFGYGRKVYRWLRKNASKFGFCQPYLSDPEKKRNPGRYSMGYNEEKWHWSYRPLASQYLKEYRRHIKRLAPGSFNGAETARKFYQEFVFNVHPECGSVL